MDFLGEFQSIEAWQGKIYSAKLPNPKSFIFQISLEFNLGVVWDVLKTTSDSEPVSFIWISYKQVLCWFRCSFKSSPDFYAIKINYSSTKLFRTS